MNIKDLYKGQSGIVIRKHLEHTVASLDRVTDIDKSLPPDIIAIEVLSRIKSIETLNNVLQLTELDKESNLPTIKKSKYGLS